ncbi:MAG: translation elongation factor-like protein [Nitrospirota bacterium]
MKEEKVGVVLHYYSKAGVAAIKLDKALKVGDKIHIKGHTTDFDEVINSIQIEHNQVNEARKGDDIGIKVIDHVREHDTVYKVTEQ